MTQISSTHKSVWLTPRTANYVAALIREGDSFDYCKWLQQVRGEKTQAKQSQRISTSRKTVAEEIACQIARPDSRQSCPTSMRLGRHVAIQRESQGQIRATGLFQPLGLDDGLKRSGMCGTSSRPVVLAMPCTDIWKPCLQLLLITKCGEKPRSFCDTHSNLRSCPSTGMRTHLLQLFAARALILPITRQSANGPERCGMLLVQKSRRCGSGSL
jgi:hypothetical protein